jgi:hypothetical protein
MMPEVLDARHLLARALPRVDEGLVLDASVMELSTLLHEGDGSDLLPRDPFPAGDAEQLSEHLAVSAAIPPPPVASALRDTGKETTQGAARVHAHAQSQCNKCRERTDVDKERSRRKQATYRRKLKVRIHWLHWAVHVCTDPSHAPVRCRLSDLTSKPRSRSGETK